MRAKDLVDAVNPVYRVEKYTVTEYAIVVSDKKTTGIRSPVCKCNDRQDAEYIKKLLDADKPKE